MAKNNYYVESSVFSRKDHSKNIGIYYLEFRFIISHAGGGCCLDDMWSLHHGGDSLLVLVSLFLVGCIKRADELCKIARAEPTGSLHIQSSW